MAIPWLNRAGLHSTFVLCSKERFVAAPEVCLETLVALYSQASVAGQDVLLRGSATRSGPGPAQQAAGMGKKQDVEVCGRWGEEVCGSGTGCLVTVARLG